MFMCTEENGATLEGGAAFFLKAVWHMGNLLKFLLWIISTTLKAVMQLYPNICHKIELDTPYAIQP